MRLARPIFYTNTKNIKLGSSTGQGRLRREHAFSDRLRDNSLIETVGQTQAINDGQQRRKPVGTN